MVSQPDERALRPPSPRLLAAVLGLGLTLRVIHFTAGRSLWIDEARVAINILSRPFAGLLHPLDFDQSAPPVYLWLVKLCGMALGPTERPLRLVSFMAGLAVLGLLYPLARRFVTGPAATFVVAAFCLSPPLIYYANEIKPYMTDALVTVLLLVAAMRWIEADGHWKAGLALAVGGGIAVWCSTPSPAILAGIGAAALVCPTVPFARRRALVLGGGALWLISFLAVYHLAHGPTAGNAYLRDFWSARLLDPGRPEVIASAWLSFRDVVWELLQGGSAEPPMSPRQTIAATGLGALVAVCCLMGARRLASRERGWRLALVGGPFAVLGVASALALYPIGLRLLIFAAPLLLLLIGAGATELSTIIPPRYRRPLGLGAAVLLFTVPLLRDIAFAATPNRWDSHRRTVREFQRLARPAEPVYVSAGSLPTWIYYTMDWSRPDTALVRMVAQVASYGGPAFENASPKDTVVMEDADGLAYPAGERTVLIGLPTGMQARAGLPLFREHPDPGWAEVEAARMQTAANPYVWAILSHLYSREAGVFRRFERAGGEPVYRWGDREAFVVKYRFAARDAAGGLR